MKMTLKQSARLDFQNKVLGMFPANRAIVRKIATGTAGIVDANNVEFTMLRTIRHNPPGEKSKSKQIFVKQTDAKLLVAFLKLDGYEAENDGNIVRYARVKVAA